MVHKAHVSENRFCGGMPQAAHETKARNGAWRRRRALTILDKIGDIVPRVPPAADIKDYVLGPTENVATPRGRGAV